MTLIHLLSDDVSFDSYCARTTIDSNAGSSRPAARTREEVDMMRSSLSTRDGFTKQTARLGTGGAVMITVVALAAAVAITMVQEASVPPAAGGIDPAPPVVNSWRISSHLEDSERANLEDALER